MKKPAALLLALACAAGASTTTAWEMNSYRDFAAGRLSGLSLARDGTLALGPMIDLLFASDQPIIWSLAAGPDGTLYAGTGHHGRVFRLDKSGKASLVWAADQPEVFALAVDPTGILYAATSPDGKIYRIENGKAVEYFNPQAKYVWALAFGKDGALYAGTGDQGRIYRIEAAGQGALYYDTGQSHVTCLALDAQGRLLAGSEPNGLIYRIAAKDNAFVLYDASLPEIRALVPAPDGAIYAAALGGSLNRRSLGGVPSAAGVPASASVSAGSATVTVEASDDSSAQSVDIKPKPDAAKPQAGASTMTPAGGAATVVDVSGVEKSAIYRINPDNTVESLWSSKEENAYDLLVSGGQVVFSTDGQGRIYRLGPDRKATLMVQTNEGEALRLLASPAGVIAATGDLGKLYRLGAGLSPTGQYESPVHDAASIARWGRLSWVAELPAGARLLFRTRSGNSIRPDRTWSDWSEPLADPKGSPVASPNARYVQWKVEFTGSAAGTPVLDSASLAYLPQNMPPVIRSINVVLQPAKPPAQPPPQATSAYSVTVTDTPDSSVQTSSGTPTQPLTRTPGDQLQIVWQADDPDGDRLVYSVYFRAEGQRDWMPLKSNLSENTCSIDADSLADGKYYFRVVASDSPSNSPANARSADLVSSPTLVDHTPPVVTLVAPAGNEIDFEAADAASPLRRCEYSLDAGPWVPLDPVGGILDSPRARFHLTLGHLAPGEHLLVVRAIDAAGNAGLAKTTLR